MFPKVVSGVAGPDEPEPAIKMTATVTTTTPTAPQNQTFL